MYCALSRLDQTLGESATLPALGAHARAVVSTEGRLAGTAGAAQAALANWRSGSCYLTVNIRQTRGTGRLDANTRGPRHSAAPVIWVFHDVSDPHWFRQRIDAITSARDVVKLADLAREPRRNGTCAITFDDGWRSVWTIAHPLLSTKEIPYTVFVCTDMLVGGPVPWFVRAQRLVARVGRDPLVQAWDLPKRQITMTRDLMEISERHVPSGSAERDRTARAGLRAGSAGA